MSTPYLVLTVLACIAAFIGGGFAMRRHMQQRNTVSDQEDPRDSQIRELLAELRVARADLARCTMSISRAEEHSTEADERVQLLQDQIKGFEHKATVALESLEREIAEKGELADELTRARTRINALESRIKELELELSATGSQDMPETTVIAETVQDDSGSHTSLIEALDAEVQRWKKHCLVLGAELKTVRARLQARPAAANGADHAMLAQGGEDPLSEIRGIGSVIERKLKQLGIRQFQQLAAITPEDMKRASVLIPDLRSRLRRDGWIEQARRLHRSKVEQLNQGAANPPSVPA